MDNFARRGVTYQSLNNEVNRTENPNAAPTMITLDHEHEDTTNVIIHKVPKNKGNLLCLISLFFCLQTCPCTNKNTTRAILTNYLVIFYKLLITFLFHSNVQYYLVQLYY